VVVVEASFDNCARISFCWSSSLGLVTWRGGGDLCRRPSPMRRMEPTVVRRRTVTSPRSLIASVERGSFSRRIEGGMRRPNRAALLGDVRNVSSGKGWAKYGAGLVVRRDFVGEGER
jgi:hypothetical protein